MPVCNNITSLFTLRSTDTHPIYFDLLTLLLPSMIMPNQCQDCRPSKSGEYYANYESLTFQVNPTVASEGYVGMTGQWVQALAVDAFLMGCLDRSALSSMNKEPQTIDEAVKLMRRLGSHNSVISAEKQSFPLEEGDGASAPLLVEMVENESVDVDQLNESIKTLTKLLAKMPQLLPVQSLRSNQSTKTFVCFTCGIQGHIARNCPRVSKESKRRKKM